jgi:hypothetical protein
VKIRVEHAGATDLTITLDAGDCVEAFTGEGVKLRVAHQALPTSIELLAAPAGASPTIEGSVLTPDVSGIFRVRLRCGELVGDLELRTLRSEALENFQLVTVRRGPDRGQVRTMRERRLVCRALIRDTDAARLLDACSPASPLPAGINLQLFGA